MINESHNFFIFILTKSFLNTSFHISSPPSFWKQEINKYQIGSMNHFDYDVQQQLQLEQDEQLQPPPPSSSTSLEMEQ